MNKKRLSDEEVIEKSSCLTNITVWLWNHFRTLCFYLQEDSIQCIGDHISFQIIEILDKSKLVLWRIRNLLS